MTCSERGQPAWVEQAQPAAVAHDPGQFGHGMGGLGQVGQEPGNEGGIDAAGAQREAAGVGQDEPGVGVAAVAAGGGQHLGGEVQSKHVTCQPNRGAQVRQRSASAAGQIEGGLPGL